MKHNISNNKKQITIFPKSLNKIIQVPASKSIMQRSVALALLSDGRTVIKNPSFSNDSLTSIRIAGAMGASVQFSFNKLTVERTDNVTETNLNFGESGLALRMFSPIISLFGKDFSLNGKGSLLKRPVTGIEDALSQSSVKVESENGFLPIQLSGKLTGSIFEIDGSISSQVLTGLLIALPKAKGDSEIIVKNLKSKPYIDLTLDMIKYFGGRIENQNYERFIIKGDRKYIAQDYTIEGDWSGAAFLLVAGLISGKTELKGLNIDSKQADKEIISVIQKAGGKITINNDSVTTEMSKLKAFEFDANDCPDLFPPLVAMAAYCKGKSVLKGVNRLKYKESDRATVLKNEFAKIGINITIKDDKMIIEGGKVSGGTTDSNNDHRIAMALGIAAIGSNSEIIIQNSDCINKSYPNFYRDIK
ncbi:MAG: 3-phosphoshikimate 1-carboxyvinyltransferase [Bacteroidales bacterium]|nr:3-phosphoshikimate 1-carboxyvinyltransferase [Bacteroidales bacterium]